MIFFEEADQLKISIKRYGQSSRNNGYRCCTEIQIGASAKYCLEGIQNRACIRFFLPTSLIMIGTFFVVIIIYDRGKVLPEEPFRDFDVMPIGPFGEVKLVLFFWNAFAPVDRIEQLTIETKD